MSSSSHSHTPLPSQRPTGEAARAAKPERQVTPSNAWTMFDAGPAVSRLLDLQHVVGNQVVQRVLRGSGAHPELSSKAPSVVSNAEIGSRIRSAAGGGIPLAPEIARRMGDRLGADLSSVRVHADPEADSLAQSVGAHAFTSGADIFFSGGAYQPGAAEGQRTLAHEVVTRSSKHVDQLPRPRRRATTRSAIPRIRTSRLPI